MDWRAAYQDHMSETRAGLKSARAAAVRFYRLSDRSVDASRLTDRQIEIEALHDAERVVNMAIHLHNDQIDRKSRK